MSHQTPLDVLVLHTVRVMGFASTDRIAARIGLSPQSVEEQLLDAEACGWITHSSFAANEGGISGWSLTERGREEDTKRLTEELHHAGARAVVEQGHQKFERLNGRLVRACTDWQLRPIGNDRLAVNDHNDPDWDTRVLDELTALGGGLTQLIDVLSGALARFRKYDRRFSAALARARAGDSDWVAGIGIGSCHAVWMELHEDLLSTLGIARDA